MAKPVVASFGLHILVVLILTLGFPYLVIPPEPEPFVIPVSIAPLDEITQTDIVAPHNETKETKEEAKPVVPPKTEPVYAKPEPEPEPEEPKIVTPKEPIVEEQIPEPVVEKTVVEEKKQEPAPVPPVKPIVKPRKPPVPKVKPEKKDKKEDVKKTESRDISSILKDLTPSKDEKPLPQTQDTQSMEPSSRSSAQAPLGSKLTRSEEDDLNSGVTPCWVVDPGMQDAHNLIVTLRVFVGPDMVVQRVVFEDMARYRSDPAYRSAAESARRALINPTCSKLRLPPEKYQYWREFIYNFDPSNMI